MGDSGVRKGAVTPDFDCCHFVVLFLEVHHFQDGNGRLRPVLTTLLVIQAACAYMPIAHVTELNKEAYYLVLRQIQGTI